MNPAETFVRDQGSRILEELKALIRIPSVSTDPARAGDCRRAAEWIRDHLKQLGCPKVELLASDTHPVVWGEGPAVPGKPTILVYGHYDVQPADPLNLWHSPPFEPVIKDEKIYARGSCDDKGQMYMHVKAFESMVRNNSLPCNVKFLIEGEEEVGSANLGDFVKNNKEKLKADVIVISDTSIIANDVPSITIGLRGLSYVEVEVTGPNRDLHSG